MIIVAGIGLGPGLGTSGGSGAFSSLLIFVIPAYQLASPSAAGGKTRWRARDIGRVL